MIITFVIIITDTLQEQTVFFPHKSYLRVILIWYWIVN